MASRSKFLFQLKEIQKVNLIILSGGKDSSLAYYCIQETKGRDIVALLTTVTEDYNRASMHGVRRAP